VIDSISFSDNAGIVVPPASKNNIKNAAAGPPTAAILMTSSASPLHRGKDDIDAKLDSFVDDLDGQYTVCCISSSIIGYIIPETALPASHLT